MSRETAHFRGLHVGDGVMCFDVNVKILHDTQLVCIQTIL